ncbi:MAG: aldo/keto reductase [Polyangiaceae bacterium]
MKLSLGTMNFGRRTSASEAEVIVRRAYDHGIRLFDTANMYCDGDSEKILGKAIAPIRAGSIIATKVGLGKRATGRGNEGLARAAILASIDASLSRLGLDYVDVLYLHAPDASTPIEETLDAIKTVLTSGKIRAWGVSNYASWQVLEMMHQCDLFGIMRPAISQVIYNLLVRQIEVEYTRFAMRYGLHTTVYNPLAGGLLSGKHTQGEIAKGSRFDGNSLYQRRYLTEPMFHLVDQLSALAAEAGMTLVDLSYAWLASRPGVDSILVGPGSVEHLDAAVDALAKVVPADLSKKIDELHRAYLGTDVRYAR